MFANYTIAKLKATDGKSALAEAKACVRDTHGKPWKLHGFIVKRDMFDTGKFVLPADVVKHIA